MAAVFALVVLVTTAIAFSVVLEKNVADMLPFTVFSIILYLYIFYCANLLNFGIASLYLLIAALCVYAGYITVKSKRSIQQAITPALCVFCCTSVFFLLYTADNFSINWDELRVWSAMPKAIYETKELQLGAQALIFDSSDNMQTYPPALPLFVNFLLTPSPAFSESCIFLAYAVFVSAITVNPFRNLRWNSWWLMPLAFVFITCAPFVLTLHGGDNSYFYESLYIDPVLGFAAGYVFYLATAKPFQTGFSRTRFALALGVLVIIKDTGILFALLSLLCALLLRCFEEKPTVSVLARDLIVPATVLVLPYLLWKGLLQYHAITNHVSVHVKIPAVQTIRALIDVLVHAPIINLIVLGFSFLVYALLLLLLCALLEAVFKIHSRANNVCTFLLAAVSFLIFSFGYITIFPYGSAAHLLELSYYRYFTTLTCAWFILCFLRYLPALLDAMPPSSVPIRVSVFIISLFICGFSTFVLTYWESDYTNPSSDFLVRARDEKAKILTEIPVDSAKDYKRVYLLMAEKEPDIFHHRFYFELIGTGINIENFYIDTDMHNALGPAPDSIETTAEKWYARLQEESYDYIYVYSVNDTYRQAFSCLGLGEAIPGHAYPVK